MDSISIFDQSCSLSSIDMDSLLTSNRRRIIRDVAESSSGGGEETRSWSDLPSELLTLIAIRLPIIELLRFRSVCKHWNAASSTASAQIESATNQQPWLLIQTKGSRCFLYKKSRGNFSPDIPEMDGATILASHQGWLLLFKPGGSIFFLCPMSSAKITLPRFPHSEISDHVAAISSPPTSPDCIVSVVNRADSTNLDLHLLRRGEENWSRHIITYHIDNFKTITCSTFYKGDFYYLDSVSAALIFSVKNKSGTRCQIVDGGGEPDRYLPFSRSQDYFVRNVKEQVKEQLFGSDKNVIITIIGTLAERNGCNEFIRNEDIRDSEKSDEQDEEEDKDCIKKRGEFNFIE